MNREEILSKVKPYIVEAKAGIKTEDDKVDLKSKWYNLIETEGKNEFLKDVTSIANTLGRDGFIIIGIDEYSQEIFQSRIVDSGLNDESKIQDLIIKNIEGGLDFSVVEIQYEGQTLSVIHIPPSIKMPHVIRSYESKKGKKEEQKTFVRKGTKILPATKYDLEKMFLYRGQIKPEYDISIYYPEGALIFMKDSFVNPTKLIMSFYSIIIKNDGIKPIISYRIFLNSCFRNFGAKIDGLQAESHIDGNVIEILSKPIMVNPSGYAVYTNLRFFAPLTSIPIDFLKNINKMFVDLESCMEFEIHLLAGEKLIVKPQKIDKIHNNFSPIVL